MSKYFDMLAYLMGKQAGGGGGGDISVVSKSISSNGTFTAPSGKAYSPVTVDVPNSYAAGDEGKVVSNGQLVAQGSDSVTQNGTVDTTLINSLTVNVSGGSGAQMASGTITLVNDTIGNNMPAINVGFDYSHILVYPNDSHLGYGGRSNGGFHYWTDGTTTYNSAITTNSGGSSSSGGNVVTLAGGSQLFSAVGQKVGNTFEFAGDSAWNGYYRAALTWSWVAW